MNYRPLGSTGLTVSEIGLGATQIGDELISHHDAERVLRTALDNGITFFDTAPRYFLSEARIGRALASRRSDIVVSTKCGPYRRRTSSGWEAASDFSREGILATVERSLKALRSEYVDVLLLHGLPDGDAALEVAVAAMADAKRRGLARFIGVSADGPAALNAARAFDLDAHELNYNLLMQENDGELIPELAARGRGIIAKRPVANAVLLGSSVDTGADANRAREAALRMPIAELAGDIPVHEFVLRFTLSHPSIATAIIGTKNPDHVVENVRLAERGPLPDEVLAAAKQAYGKAAR